MALKQKSVFAATVHVLGAPSMAWCIEDHVDIPSQRIDWDSILEKRRLLSGGEQALVDIAWTLWRDDPMPINLVLLDDASLERVLEAVMALRPLGSFRPATEIADEAIGMFIESLDRNADGQKWVNNTAALDIARAQAVQEIREGMAVREEDLR